MINNKINNLWLIFTLKDNLYAIDANYTNAIIEKPQNITPVPDSAPFVKGLITMRDTVITLIGLRELFSLPSLTKEFDEFKQMLEQRKNDHVHWVHALEKSIAEKTKFTLATDPHKCAFGQWYYKYKPASQTVKFQLDKIEEPHRVLHETAVKMEKINENPTEHSEKELNNLLVKAEKQLVPTVLNLIDNAKLAFEAAHKEMVITLHDDKTDTVGIILDEVLGVEEIDILSNKNEEDVIYNNEYIQGIAKRKNGDELILIVNAAAIIKTSQSQKH